MSNLNAFRSALQNAVPYADAYGPIYFNQNAIYDILGIENALYGTSVDLVYGQLSDGSLALDWVNRAVYDAYNAEVANWSGSSLNIPANVNNSNNASLNFAGGGAYIEYDGNNLTFGNATQSYFNNQIYANYGIAMNADLDMGNQSINNVYDINCANTFYGYQVQAEYYTNSGNNGQPAFPYGLISDGQIYLTSSQDVNFNGSQYLYNDGGTSSLRLSGSNPNFYVDGYGSFDAGVFINDSGYYGVFGYGGAGFLINGNNWSAQNGLSLDMNGYDIGNVNSIGVNYIYPSASSTPYIDMVNGYLADFSGNTSIDWTTRYLADSSGITSVDWSARTLHDTFGNVIITYATGANVLDCVGGIGALYLQGVNGTDPYVDLMTAGSGFLNDGNYVSVDWVNRLLKNVAGANTVDWEFGALNDSTGSGKIDWENSLLYDSGAWTSIDWQSRQLCDTSGFPILDWSNAVLPIYINGDTGIDGNLYVNTMSNLVNDGPVEFLKGVKLAPTAVASLVGVEGTMAYVNDANAPSVGATVAGGGSAKCLVCYNNTNWIVTALL